MYEHLNALAQKTSLHKLSIETVSKLRASIVTAVDKAN